MWWLLPPLLVASGHTRLQAEGVCSCRDRRPDKAAHTPQTSFCLDTHGQALHIHTHTSIYTHMDLPKLVGLLGVGSGSKTSGMAHSGCSRRDSDEVSTLPSLTTWEDFMASEASGTVTLPHTQALFDTQYTHSIYPGISFRVAFLTAYRPFPFLSTMPHSMRVVHSGYINNEHRSETLSVFCVNQLYIRLGSFVVISIRNRILQSLDRSH